MPSSVIWRTRRLFGRIANTSVASSHGGLDVNATSEPSGAHDGEPL